MFMCPWGTRMADLGTVLETIELVDMHVTTHKKEGPATLV